MSAIAMVVVATVVGLPTQAAGQVEPQTHIDSLFPTTSANWMCTNGNGGRAGPDDNLFCRTDNSNTSWWPDSNNNNGTGDIRNPATVNSVLEAAYEPTDLTMTRASSPDTSGGAETDIMFQQGSLLPGRLGQTWCNDAVDGSSTRCDQHYVQFSSHFPLRYAICHETGHAVGLTHGDYANPVQSNGVSYFYCMRTPLPPTSDRAAHIGGPFSTIGSQLNAQY